MIERPGIYGIRLDDRWYVGSASNISKRWSRHRIDLDRGIHRNRHLQSAWDKYGGERFEWVILELTDDLTAREQYWLDRLDAYADGFNLCPIARSSRGRRWSADERQARQGRMRPTPHPAALTAGEADEIRELYGEGRGPSQPHGRWTMARLAARYRVGMRTIHSIVHRYGAYA